MTRSLPRCDLFLPSLTGLSGVPVVKSAPATSSANHVANAGKGKGGGEARRLTMWTGRRAARAALRSEQVCGVVGSLTSFEPFSTPLSISMRWKRRKLSKVFGRSGEDMLAPGVLSHKPVSTTEVILKVRAEQHAAREQGPRARPRRMVRAETAGGELANRIAGVAFGDRTAQSLAWRLLCL